MSSEGKRTIEGKRCIACGEPVRVVTAEGTSHYESVAASEVERLRKKGTLLAEALQEIIDAVRDGRAASSARFQRLVDKARALNDEDPRP